MCGVEPRHEPPATWLGTVTERLGADLDSFRSEVEGSHDQIAEWGFRGGRVFAATGGIDDEANPFSGYGWMCRLLHAGLLGAAGLPGVRKAALHPEVSDSDGLPCGCGSSNRMRELKETRLRGRTR